MSTFKSDLYAICTDVAAGFSGWSFASGRFKNSTLQYAELVIHLGFGFEYGVTPVSPGIFIYNKKVSKLCKYLLETDQSVATSIVDMQDVAHLLKFTSGRMRTGYEIRQDKQRSLAIARASQSFKEETIQLIDEKTVDISEAHSALTATLKDGIDFIKDHYDLSGEHVFLNSLPPKYTTRHEKIRYNQFEEGWGLMLCIVRILLGDFDFVVRYRSDDFKTIYPKRTEELNKIIAKLPELKKRYAETGSVI